MEIKVINKIRDQTSRFFKENLTPDESPNMVSEAYKMPLRGEIISISAHPKTILHAQEVALENVINNLEITQRNSGPSKILQNLHCHRYMYNSLYSSHMGTLQLKEFGKIYEITNRSGKVMASYIHTRAQRTRIHKMVDSSGASYINDQNIHNVVYDYCKQLYQSEVNPSKRGMSTFFYKLHLPSLS